MSELGAIDGKATLATPDIGSLGRNNTDVAGFVAVRYHCCTAGVGRREICTCECVDIECVHIGCEKSFR